MVKVGKRLKGLDKQAAATIIQCVARGWTVRRMIKKLSLEHEKNTETHQHNPAMQCPPTRGTFIRSNFAQRPAAPVEPLKLHSDPRQLADAYLEQHKLLPLLGLLAQMLIGERPPDPRAFLASTLERIDSAKLLGTHLHLYREEEVETLYSMYATGTRGISRAQCRQALDAMGLESVRLPEELGSAGEMIKLEQVKALVPPPALS